MDTCSYAGSYSSIWSFLKQPKDSHPDVATVFDFDPRDVARLDVGRGPTMKDVLIHQTIAMWVFVMLLSGSRHQYGAQG